MNNDFWYVPSLPYMRQVGIPCRHLQIAEAMDDAELREPDFLCNGAARTNIDDWIVWAVSRRLRGAGAPYYIMDEWERTLNK